MNFLTFRDFSRNFLNFFYFYEFIFYFIFRTRLSGQTGCPEGILGNPIKRGNIPIFPGFFSPLEREIFRLSLYLLCRPAPPRPPPPPPRTSASRLPPPASRQGHCPHRLQPSPPGAPLPPATTAAIVALPPPDNLSWLWRKGPSGFSFSSTVEQVTKGIDASHLIAIVTGFSQNSINTSQKARFFRYSGFS